MVEDDRLIRELYAGSNAQPGSDHPDDRSWEAMALGELPPEQRRELLDHVSRCADCAQIYRGLKMLAAEAALFDPAVPRPASKRLLPFRSRWVYGGLAAAAVLVFMLRPPSPPGASPPPGPPGTTTLPEETMRSSAESAPIPLEPRGTLAGPPRAFRWQAVAQSSRHRIELFSRTGDLLWASPPVEGATVDWPATVPPAAGRYYWQVIALADANHPLSAPAASALTSFDIASP